MSDFSDGSLRDMALALYQKLGQGNDFFLEEYITKLEPEKASELIHLSKVTCNFDNPDKAFDDILLKLETIKLEEEKKDILMRLKNITDMDEKKQLQKRLQLIIKKMTER